MRKKVFGRKFSRDYGSRQALFRALTRALLISGSINTTKAKAKALQPDVDSLVNLAKTASVSSLRQAYATLGNDRDLLKILQDRIAPAFNGRLSGYTRIISLPTRSGDNADLARLEWVEKIEVVTKQDSPKKKEKIVKKEVTKKSPKKDSKGETK